jgi:hypothetical protein
MKNLVNKVLLSLLITAGFGMTGAYAASSSAATEDKEAARQTTPDTSPKAAYQRKVKEIRAAHRDNLANCKSMSGAERSSCVKEANQILKSDLADAKTGSTSGASGTSGSSDTSGIRETVNPSSDSTGRSDAAAPKDAASMKAPVPATPAKEAK